jgi:hypothetical protein
LDVDEKIGYDREVVLKNGGANPKKMRYGSEKK